MFISIRIIIHLNKFNGKFHSFLHKSKIFSLFNTCKNECVCMLVYLTGRVGRMDHIMNYGTIHLSIYLGWFGNVLVFLTLPTLAESSSPEEVRLSALVGFPIVELHTNWQELFIRGLLRERKRAGGQDKGRSAQSRLCPGKGLPTVRTCFRGRQIRSIPLFYLTWQWVALMSVGTHVHRYVC